ncbi:hypothetical protein SARC_14496 [Sphaeroforma arctica JP610]|uniref:LNR domain-containing protein n=1 Tax=Sphaeroforma arctica JP610 TaxID=667725 RepID=A0A0L0F899_9EUKA|nr:hypothetical protein SARC_14496 [Sphaeroforma arctica JP610]KNC72942.1 hypothetical protein SARC_14496 [Sphaeroforma arctica JP610]|eukprot:XP_014146844.1 hypothetical protein SARC_14496 [Sphaeroforma arctica JP610]
MSSHRPLPTAPAWNSYDNVHESKSSDQIYETLDETNTYFKGKYDPPPTYGGDGGDGRATGLTRKKKIAIGSAFGVLVVALIVMGVALSLLISQGSDTPHTQPLSSEPLTVAQTLPTVSASLTLTSAASASQEITQSTLPSPTIITSMSLSRSLTSVTPSPSTSPSHTLSNSPTLSASASTSMAPSQTPSMTPSPSTKYCSSGCVQTMLGNQECDIVCDVSACSWDGGDCDNDIAALADLSGELQDKPLVIVPMKVISGNNDRVIDLFSMGLNATVRTMFDRCKIECERWTACASFEIVVDKEICTLAKVKPGDEGVELKTDNNAALGYS